MNRGQRHKISSGLALIFLLLIILSCDAYIRLNGKVVDEDGKPIGGAKIVVSADHIYAEKVSKEDGTFDIIENINPIGSFTIKLTVSKENFEIYEGKFNSNKLPINPNVDPELEKQKIIVLSRKTTQQTR